LTFDREFAAPNMNANFERPPKSLPSKYSTSISTSDPVHVSFSNPKKCAQDIRKVLFNDKAAQLNPQRESDYIKNFTKPNKEDYRVKRCQTYYPNNPQTMGKDTITEYDQTYNKKG